MIKKFRDLIVTITHQPAEIQKQILIEEINKWKDNYSQTDDMLVIGIRI
jgi:hypothetical protein